MPEFQEKLPKVTLMLEEIIKRVKPSDLARLDKELDRAARSALASILSKRH